MNRIYKYWPVALSMALMACSSDPSAPVDRSTDTGVIEDMAQVTMDMAAADQATDTPDLSSPRDMTRDQSMPVEDLGVEDLGVEDSGQDMMQVEDMPEDMPEQDAGVEDMAQVLDMPEDMSIEDMSEMGGAYADRAQGDCTSTSECGSADLFCERSAVGGTCFGPCAACDDIPGPNTYECIAGSCVPECGDDTDCPPGRTCNTRRGVCQVQRCTANVCPVPWFGCSEPDGICVRQACDAGEVCPAQTQCDGSYCIEDHSIR